MQLMPETAQAYGVDNVYDPRRNLRAGATHLRDLLRRYDGDLHLALAAYNAGPEAVERYGGVPPYSETRNYVIRVLARLDEERRRGSDPAVVFRYRDAGGALVLSNVPARAVAQAVRLAELP
jgi:soluble lytic murein transglycosylase-like protein